MNRWDVTLVSHHGVGYNMDPRAKPGTSATVDETNGFYTVHVNGQGLRTPAGNLVSTDSAELAQAIADELQADGAADVTSPSLYSFFSTQRDFIDPDPDRTVDVLVELLAHDYLLHPDDALENRQLQLAAWQPQIELWRRIAGHDPPFAEPPEEPPITDQDAESFHYALSQFNTAQLAIAIQATNLLKSATLGMLLARAEIDAGTGLDAASITLRLLASDYQDEQEREEQREEQVREILSRLLRYAEFSHSS